MHAGKWDKKSLQGVRTARQDAGHRWAAGGLGSKWLGRAKAFGMELIGYDPFIAPVIARENDM